jgi:hypothetical protein
MALPSRWHADHQEREREREREKFMNFVASENASSHLMDLATLLTVDLATTPTEIAIRICDQRSDSLALFAALTAGQQQQLASDAWTVGLRALSNAYRQAQEVRLQDIGKTLVDDVDQQLKAYIADQEKTIAAVLGKFFDPADGQVTQRLAAFVDDQGVLARLLDKYIGPQNSVLAQSLARQVGESSPLFKKLSPTDSEGLVKLLEAQFREVMNEGHADLVHALDPLAEDGAVARFLKSLREELKGANEDQATQLASALNALDANDDDSLINRLMRETNAARRAVLHAVNPDAPDSAMSVIKQTLTALLKEHSRSQAEAFRLQQERQQIFETEIRDAVIRIESRRSQDQKTPRGGLDFQGMVVRFVTGALRGGPYTVEATGNTVGLRARCKVGDAVIRFTQESAFQGAGTVIEAKRDASYTSRKALEELEIARPNRNTGAGVFVMARSHAPDTFPIFERHGNNVLVVWDETDASTDPYLHAAILLGLTLATRTRTVGSEGDLHALRDIEARIEAELGRLQKMTKLNRGIRQNSDDVAEEIRKAMHSFELLLRNAKSTLIALNIELNDEALERSSPIGLPVESYHTAVAAVNELSHITRDALLNLGEAP